MKLETNKEYLSATFVLFISTESNNHFIDVHISHTQLLIFHVVRRNTIRIDMNATEDTTAAEEFEDDFM
jgi:hypothetical protein